jgi:hypothetical protein
MKQFLSTGILIAFLLPALYIQAQVTTGTGGAMGANSPTTNTNVGIFYTNPQVPLDIKSEMRVTSPGGSNWLSIATPGASHTIRTTNNLGLRVDNNGQLNFTLGGVVRTTMLNNGWVGMGIASSPNNHTKLHVHDGAVMVSGPNAAGGAMIIFSDNIAANAYPNGRWGIEYIPNQGLNFTQLWNPVTGGGSNYALFVKDDQKVGIGVDPNISNAFPAGYRLYVKDGILTEKVKVAVYLSSNWSDYVFADDYHLQPLSEVEAYIKAHKHLPSIPSAQEIVDEGGIDVQQMMAKQMEKIEELTLYIIAQEKRIATLEAGLAK